MLCIDNNKYCEDRVKLVYRLTCAQPYFKGCTTSKFLFGVYHLAIYGNSKNNAIP